MTSIYPESSNRIKYIHRSVIRYRLRNNHYKVKNKNKNKWRSILFPSSVNLITHPNETLNLINSANNLYKKSFNVDFDMSNVVKFSPESITLMAAIIKSKEFTNNLLAKGTIPKNKFVADLFYQSGFFDHVSYSGTIPKIKTGRMLHTETQKQVEPIIVNTACDYLVEKGVRQYIDDLEPMYNVLIEAMQNTNNHASDRDRGIYDWWFSYNENNDGYTHFTFLDLGVGIFNSIPVKTFLRNITDKVNLTSNLDLVNPLLAGEIKSSTTLRVRGRGIPQIYEESKDPLFSEFYIISNNIFVNCKDDEKVLLKNDFNGTLFYWTIKTT